MNRLAPFSGALGDFHILEERVCDAFAVELLLPSCELEKRLRGNNLNLDIFFEMVSRYEISLRAASMQVARLTADYAFVLASPYSIGSHPWKLRVRWG